MRCLSHIFIFKKDRTFKNFYPGMEKTRICYFCVKKIKKMNEKQLRLFNKNFLKPNHKNQSYNQQSLLSGQVLAHKNG